MAILKFITREELDNLDDDPRIAFMELVNLAQLRLGELTDPLDPSEDHDRLRIDELQHSFMNVVVASAKRFEIEPFTSMEIPKYMDFGMSDHRQFQADLDHYTTQLMLDSSLRAKRDSVAILPQSKERIRAQLNGLRQCVEQSNMSDAKREALLSRLDEFEKELEKRRLNITVVALFTCTILGIPGSVWASGEVVQKLTSTIMQVVADAKVAEEETRKLPPATTPKTLSPPRKTPQPRRPDTRGGYELDDDIPF